MEAGWILGALALFGLPLLLLLGAPDATRPARRARDGGRKLARARRPSRPRKILEKSASMREKSGPPGAEKRGHDRRAPGLPGGHRGGPDTPGKGGGGPQRARHTTAVERVLAGGPPRQKLRSLPQGEPRLQEAERMLEQGSAELDLDDQGDMLKACGPVDAAVVVREPGGGARGSRARSEGCEGHVCAISRRTRRARLPAPGGGLPSGA